jgi:hypothetical protein
MSEGSAAQKEAPAILDAEAAVENRVVLQTPLEDTAGAHRAVENGATGKVLIAVD